MCEIQKEEVLSDICLDKKNASDDDFFDNDSFALQTS